MSRLTIACALLAASLASPLAAQSSFVRESTLGFLAHGRAADGTTSLFAIDRASGIVRHAALNADGSLTWSDPYPSGVSGIAAAALWRSQGSTEDRLAVTAPDHNRIESPASPSASAVSHPVTPMTGPASLVGLHPTSAAAAHFVAATSANGDPAFALSGLSHHSGILGNALIPDSLPGRANAVSLNPARPPLAAFIFDGQWQAFSASAAGLIPAASFPIPDATTTWTFGAFNQGNPLAQVLYASPGSPDLLVRHASEPAPGSFSFSPEIPHTLPSGIAQLIAVPSPFGTRLAVLFSDGTASLFAFDGTNPPVLLTDYPASPDGPFLFAAPNPAGLLVLFSGTLGQPLSASVFNAGSQNPDATPVSSSLLPVLSPLTPAETVWIFAGEPFANPAATAVSGRRLGSWASSPNAIPRSLEDAVSILPFRFSSESAGLIPLPETSISDPIPNRFALPAQFLPDAGLISFSPLASAAGRPSVSFAPAPGTYLPLPPADGNRDGSVAAVSLSLSSSSPGTIRFRTSPSAPWSSWPPVDLSDPLNPVPLAALPINETTTVEAFLLSAGSSSPITRATYRIANPDALTIPDSTDANLNGLADAWEFSFNQSDPNADPDNDGFSNLDEQNAGTDPLDNGHLIPNPPLNSVRLDLAASNGTLSLAWPDNAGPVILESSPDMITWAPVDPQPDTNSWSAPLSGQRSFYRLRRP
jgi:hypothetical protein